MDNKSEIVDFTKNSLFAEVEARMVNEEFNKLEEKTPSALRRIIKEVGFRLRYGLFNLEPVIPPRINTNKHKLQSDRTLIKLHNKFKRD